MTADLGKPTVGTRVLWLFGAHPRKGRVGAITPDGEFFDLQFEDGSGRGHIHWSQVVRIGEEEPPERPSAGGSSRPSGIASSEDVGRPTLGGD